MLNEIFGNSFLRTALRRREILIIVTALGLAFWTSPLAAQSQSVTLAWNPSPDTNSAGYMLYQSTDGTNFDTEIDAGNNTTLTVTGLTPGSSNYFEVVAYDADDVQSPPSNEIGCTVPLPNWTLSVQASPAVAGGVSGGGTFTSGTMVSAMAMANTDNAFVNWTQNGIVQSLSSNYSFIITSNCNLVANFVTNPVIYTVATQSSPANAGSVGGGGNFSAGSSVTVTATANSGYAFTNWTQNGVAQSYSPNYAFMLAGNRTLVANFVVTYTVAASGSPANGGSVTGGGTFVGQFRDGDCDTAQWLHLYQLDAKWSRAKFLVQLHVRPRGQSQFVGQLCRQPGLFHSGNPRYAI